MDNRNRTPLAIALIPFIAIAAVIVFLLVDNEDNAPAQNNHAELVADAEKQWADMESGARFIVCQMWHENGQDEDLFMDVIANGENDVTPEEAEARIEVMKKEC